MSRADRLFQIIQLLRRRKVVTAAFMAEQLDVSERTVYRDVRDLVMAGTPIDSEAGVGYSLKTSYDLPPLMFNEEEIQALVLGTRIVASFGDASLAKASRSALAKVESVLPGRLKSELRKSALFAPNPSVGARISQTLIPVRQAMSTSRKLRLRYQKESGEVTWRVVRPLAASFWGKTWTLSAWCELREDFRSFRIDRIERVEILEAFLPEPGRTLDDLLARFGPGAAELLGP